MCNGQWRRLRLARPRGIESYSSHDEHSSGQLRLRGAARIACRPPWAVDEAAAESLAGTGVGAGVGAVEL